MVTVDISEIQGSYGEPMLIVRDSLGVCYRTQAGGVRCAKPHQQGFLVPLLSGEFDTEGEIRDLWLSVNATVADRAAAYFDRVPLLKRLLKECELDDVLEPIDSPEMFMMVIKEWGEAWFPVCIKEEPNPDSVNYTAIKALKGSYAILTYKNSD